MVRANGYGWLSLDIIIQPGKVDKGPLPGKGLDFEAPGVISWLQNSREIIHFISSGSFDIKPGTSVSP